MYTKLLFIKNIVEVGATANELHRCVFSSAKGPYIKDVRKIFGFFDPLPPCPHFGQIYSAKITQPPLSCLLLGYFPPPLPVRTSFM